MESSLENALNDGKLYRKVNSLIVAHLRDNKLNQASHFFHYNGLLSISSSLTSISVWLLRNCTTLFDSFCFWAFLTLVD